MSMINELIEKVKAKNPGEPEFHQAVKEVLETLEPTVKKHPEFVKAKIYERIVEPDRAIMFRVPWVDDKGEVQVNRGFRVQFNNAIGPYKGGLRFHPSVNLGIIKFLGFEQIFKNSLTTLPMGGGKGGSDFDPKGKSDMEVMRFCQAFMRELFRHIGADVDVPAGDIGVGGREIGYHVRLLQEDPQRAHRRADRPRPWNRAASLIRPEATGYGSVYFAAEMLATRGKDFKGLRCAVSGSGNVAQYTVEKINQLGGKVITLSDSNGTIVDEEGIDAEKLAYVIDLKEVQRGRIKEYAAKYKAKYYRRQERLGRDQGQSLKIDVAFPSATQNEINEEHAQALVKNGCFCVSEGANMPSNLAAIKVYQEQQRPLRTRPRPPTPAAWPPPAWRWRRRASACTGAAKKSTRSCTAS